MLEKYKPYYDYHGYRFYFYTQKEWQSNSTIIRIDTDVNDRNFKHSVRIVDEIIDKYSNGAELHRIVEGLIMDIIVEIERWDFIQTTKAEHGIDDDLMNSVIQGAEW